MKIAVFLHGTIIMHRSALGCSREERVRQVQQKELSVRDYAAYVPVDQAVSKLRTWSEQGATITYVSSHTRSEHVEQDKNVLRTFHFPPGEVVFREGGETYQNVVERILPDILIEDDCESIGGEPQMISPYLRPELQASIRSIVVKEFEGIDHLPDGLAALRDFRGSNAKENIS